jgi:hypothetical protein
MSPGSIQHRSYGQRMLEENTSGFRGGINERKYISTAHKSKKLQQVI